MVCSPHRYIVEDLARRAYFTSPIMPPQYQVSFGRGGYTPLTSYGQSSLYEGVSQTGSELPYSMRLVNESAYQLGGLYQRNSAWLLPEADVVSSTRSHVVVLFQNEPRSGGHEKAVERRAAASVVYNSNFEYVPERNVERERVVEEREISLKDQRKAKELAELIRGELESFDQRAEQAEGNHV